MVRETSIEAYRKITDENLLGPFQLDTYKIMFRHGPVTVGEAWLEYRKINPSSKRGRNEVAKRVYELRMRGVVYDTGRTKICPVSGFENILWDVTAKLPVKIEKTKSKKCPHCLGTGLEKEWDF